MTIKEIKEKIEKAKSELTKAEAVLGEVKENLEKDINALKELGVSIPDKGDMEEKEYYEKCRESAASFLSEIETSINSNKEDLAKLLEKFEEKDDEDVGADPF